MNEAPEDLEKDEGVVRLIDALAKESPEDWGPAQESLAWARVAGAQYDAGELRIELKRLCRQWLKKRVAFLGLIREDLYASDYNFVFGQADTGAGVLSYARFRAEFNDETPSRRRLMDRLLKQALASAGHVFDVDRCTSPVCARAFPISLEEHDAKSVKMCEECRAGFDRAFGRGK